jgi:Na+/melibiose symporter-like transporter
MFSFAVGSLIFGIPLAAGNFLAASMNQMSEHLFSIALINFLLTSYLQA